MDTCAHQVRRWESRDHRRHVGGLDPEARPEGYRLLGAFGPDEAAASAIAGFRVTRSLSWDRHVRVDDLSTRATARRRGPAGRLLARVHEEAVRLGCREVHLDSGVGPARHDAHRRYLTAGYAITAHHFVRPVSP